MSKILQTKMQSRYPIQKVPVNEDFRRIRLHFILTWAALNIIQATIMLSFLTAYKQTKAMNMTNTLAYSQHESVVSNSLHGPFILEVME